MAKLSDEEVYKNVIRSVCEGGYSSIVDIVRMVDIDKLRDMYEYYDDEEEEEENETTD